MKKKGVTILPELNLLECYMDASHDAGEWKQQSAAEDSSMKKSQTGYVIAFTKCPLVWNLR